jgi:hypothetical protein
MQSSGKGPPSPLPRHAIGTPAFRTLPVVLRVEIAAGQYLDPGIDRTTMSFEGSHSIVCQKPHLQDPKPPSHRRRSATWTTYVQKFASKCMQAARPITTGSHHADMVAAGQTSMQSSQSLLLYVTGLASSSVPSFWYVQDAPPCVPNRGDEVQALIRIALTNSVVAVVFELSIVAAAHGLSDEPCPQNGLRHGDPAATVTIAVVLSGPIVLFAGRASRRLPAHEGLAASLRLSYSRGVRCTQSPVQ